MSTLSPAPFDQYILSNCNDISSSRFHLKIPHPPLTSSSFLQLSTPLCPNSNSFAYSTTKVISHGELLNPSIQYLNINETSTSILHFGLEIYSSFRYEITLLSGVHNSVDALPPTHTIMDGTLDPEGIGVSLYRYSKKNSEKSQQYFPHSGILMSGPSDFGMQFSCLNDRQNKYKNYLEEMTSQITLKVDCWNASPPYQQFQPVMLTFRKTCGPNTYIPSWPSGYGSPDDLGHLAGSLPLLIYSLILCLNSLPRIANSFLGFRKFFIVKIISTPPYGDGYLDSIVLFLGGVIPAVIHWDTLNSTNKSVHEKYHFLGHLFTAFMGLLSFTIRIRLPNVPDISLPVCTALIAILFTFHMQHNPVSASLHLIYAMVMVIFSVLRIMTFFNKEIGVFAAFSGAWASLLIFCASEDGVKYEINSNLDVPATALLTGIISASLIVVITCLGAGRTREFARMADDDYTDYAHSKDDFERLKDLTLSSIKSFEGMRRRRGGEGKGYEEVVGVEEEEEGGFSNDGFAEEEEDLEATKININASLSSPSRTPTWTFLQPTTIC
ncbi:hypothetical protein TL16_g02962 [Triparma laevis f. inornata]|uniref:Uncharacterized protein n=1 Tax=Triparma laevis f. inornata TaxID=1714386 RepID=A0A9W6ZZL9_9STRA|nr:hypothetical protein TL16_g02962 [Triparma laevis f. inornata]